MNAFASSCTDGHAARAARQISASSRARTPDSANVDSACAGSRIVSLLVAQLRSAMNSIGLDARHSFQVHDLLSEGRFLWQGSRSYVELVPESLPAHILRVRRWVRTERDFDYYL